MNDREKTEVTTDSVLSDAVTRFVIPKQIKAAAIVRTGIVFMMKCSDTLGVLTGERIGARPSSINVAGPRIRMF